MKHHTLIKRLINGFMITGMIFGVLFGFSGATQVNATAGQTNISQPTQTLPESDTGIYIVQLTDPSISLYSGGISGLAPTSPQAIGVQRLDPSSAASQAYLAYLNGQQQKLVSAMQSTFGHSIEVVYNYQYTLNAVAVRITHDEALQAFNLSGVKTVYADKLNQLDTDMGPTLIGAPSIWNGDTIGDVATKGEGIVVGMIDSGINHAHPSFAATGPDGYPIVNPYGDGVFHGDCTTIMDFCNNKLIGAYDLYPGGSGGPEDTDGHGSHTSSTAAGDAIDATFTVGTTEFTRAISGVAPHANLVAYKVCNPSCPDSASVAAVNLAIGTDMVDVINYSISGVDNPWVDPVDQAFLDAFAAGIFVSASAGNAGPGYGTVAHTGPWNSSVAASTHSRIIANTLDITAAGGNLSDIAAVPGDAVVISSDLNGPILYAGDVDPSNINACAAFPANSFDGMIGLAQRGACTFAQKITNLADAGATGVVIFNNVGGPPTTMGSVPATPDSVMVTLDDGQAIVDLISGDPTAEVTIYEATQVIIDTAWQDIIAGFSSRGPSNFELLKPDYTAPGVNILAAYAASGDDPYQFAFLQGTSMSSPHSAGSAALMMALRPDWSVAEIRSAMDSTADPTPVKDSNGIDPADPFEMGSGRLALGNTGSAGLVLDETAGDYVAADPNTGGDPKTLNQPSMVNFNCVDSCSWTRSVTSVLPEEDTWVATTTSDPNLFITVTPDQFTLAPGETVELTISADTTSASAGDTLFGSVILTPEAAATTNLPVVVSLPAAPTISVDPTEIDSTQNAELVTVPLSIANLGDANLDWQIYDGQSVADWSENFDEYPTGFQLHGQGGWSGWGGDPNAGALTSDVQAYSTPNSVDILGASDLVHSYSGYTSGVWTYTAWQYIPTDFDGTTYFILLNTYTNGGADTNWSTQVNFNSATGLVTNDGSAGGTLPMITGQWVEIRDEINLDSDTQSFYYGGDLLFSGSWSDGMSGGGAVNIAAVDLFANSASSVFYDDISISQFVDTPWLSADPTSGTTDPQGSSDVDVMLDGTGMDLGVYTSTLFVSSNDPINPLVQIPVTMTLVGAPEIVVNPTSLDANLQPNGTTTVPVTITNNGEAPLDWTINEVEGLANINVSSSATQQSVNPRQVTLSLDSQPANGNITNTPLNPQDQVSLTLDDGSVENDVGINDGTNDYQFIWLNRFTPDAADFPFTLDQIQVFFDSGTGVNVGDEIDLVVYQDSDGDPTNGATWLATYNVTVQAADGVTWSVYDLPSPLYVSGPGDVLIGAINRYTVSGAPPKTYPAAIDTGASQQRSWIGWWNLDPPDPANLPPDAVFATIDGLGLPGNWLIRASGNTFDVPWLSEDPTSGTVQPGESVVVNVTFDATGLVSGVYTANLDVNSNDPSMPTIQIPVTLTVNNMLYLPFVQK